MMRLLLLTITLAVFLVDSSKAEFTCHHWTADEIRWLKPEYKQPYCERGLGYMFTGGNNEEYPGCGDCLCCKRIDLVCHHWTEEDSAAMPENSTIEEQRQHCEDVLGYTFTQGDNQYHPECETCWCCKPKDLVCHHWTEGNNNYMGPSPTIEVQKYTCEELLGYTFTQGDNYFYPNCEECSCCKPEGAP